LAFPKPYKNEVPKEGSDGLMEYTSFPTMGIGARRSGLPKDNPNGIKSLDHVGGSAQGKK
jgi:hypothetical protein